MTTQMLPFNGLIAGEFVGTPGTSMPFHMSSPPLGWVQSVAAGFNDASMRATNVGTQGGGSTGWSSWYFGGTFNMNGFTLSTAQLPPHSHGVNDPQHSHSFSQVMWTYDGSTNGTTGLFGPGSNQVAAVNTSNSANLSNNNNGSSATITPTITTPQVKFTSFCVAVRS